MSKNRPFKYPFREEDRPNRIHYWRTARGLTLEQLGDRLGWSAQRLSKYETGRIPVALEHLRSIAKALDVAPADLLKRSDNPYAMDAQEKAIFAAMQDIPGGKKDEFFNTVMPLIRLFAESNGGRARQAR